MHFQRKTSFSPSLLEMHTWPLPTQVEYAGLQPALPSSVLHWPRAASAKWALHSQELLAAAIGTPWNWPPGFLAPLPHNSGIFSPLLPFWKELLEARGLERIHLLLPVSASASLVPAPLSFFMNWRMKKKKNSHATRVPFSECLIFVLVTSLSCMMRYLCIINNSM